MFTFIGVAVVMILVGILYNKGAGPKISITKEITNLGGKVISTKQYMVIRDKNNPCVKEAIKLRDELKEKSIYNVDKHCENYYIYDVKYLLNGEEKNMYCMIYGRKIKLTGSKKFDLEWIDEEKIDVMVEGE